MLAHNDSLVYVGDDGRVHAVRLVPGDDSELPFIPDLGDVVGISGIVATCGWTNHGAFHCWEDQPVGLYRIDGMSDVVDAAVGVVTIVAIRRDGSLWTAATEKGKILRPPRREIGLSPFGRAREVRIDGTDQPCVLTDDGTVVFGDAVDDRFEWKRLPIRLDHLDYCRADVVAGIYQGRVRSLAIGDFSPDSGRARARNLEAVGAASVIEDLGNCAVRPERGVVCLDDVDDKTAVMREIAGTSDLTELHDKCGRRGLSGVVCWEGGNKAFAPNALSGHPK